MEKKRKRRRKWCDMAHVPAKVSVAIANEGAELTSNTACFENRSGLLGSFVPRHSFSPFLLPFAKLLPNYRNLQCRNGDRC